MGKGTLFILAASIVGSSILLYQTRDTSSETSARQAEQQNKVLAREVARSAYNMALRKAREFEWNKMQADESYQPEDIVELIGTDDKVNDGTYRGGAYQVWAQKIEGSSYRIGARGFHGRTADGGWEEKYVINGSGPISLHNVLEIPECETCDSSENGYYANVSLDNSTAGYCSGLYLQRFVPKDNKGHGNNYDHDDSDNPGESDFSSDEDDDEIMRGSLNSRYRIMKPDLLFTPDNGMDRNTTYTQVLLEPGTRINFILSVHADWDCPKRGQDLGYDDSFYHYQRRALKETTEKLSGLSESKWAITEEHKQSKGVWRIGFEDLPDSKFSENQLEDIKANGYPSRDRASEWDGSTYGGDGWKHDPISGYVKYKDQGNVPDFDDQVIEVELVPANEVASAE